MARRHGFTASEYIKFDGGEPPNRKVPAITAELRCFWPGPANINDVLAAIDEVRERAVEEANKAVQEGKLRNEVGDYSW